MSKCFVMALMRFPQDLNIMGQAVDSDVCDRFFIQAMFSQVYNQF
jgi:hypothetical protein